MTRQNHNCASGFSGVRILFAIFSIILFVRMDAFSADPIQKATPDDIAKAIAKATRHLRTKGLSASVNLNRSALGATALMKAGVEPDHPKIREILDRVASTCRGGKFSPTGASSPVYDVGVYLMTLTNGDPEAYKAEIQTLVNWIVAEQRNNGSWDYPKKDTGDNSQTQYALLGLWEASRVEINAPIQVFEKAARWHITRQRANGGFGYHPLPNNQGDPSTHSMTAAGIGSLHICRLFLFPNAKPPQGESAIQAETRREKQKEREKKKKRKFGILEEPEEVRAKIEGTAAKQASSAEKGTRLSAVDASIGKALRWMDANYTIEKPSGWPVYYLYSLERMSALSNSETISGHDWYQEGADFFVATQKKEGNWHNRSGRVATTAFAVMFLARATHKMLGRSRRIRRLKGGLLAGGRGLPENLAEINVKGGQVKKRKYSGPVDELLAVLENPKNKNFFDAQEALVETVITKDPKALVGKTKKLLKLAQSPNEEVRRTAMWALGRSQDITVVPTLITALNDSNLDVVVEARNALRFLSKKIEGVGLPDQPKPADRKKAIAIWRKWYLTVRPYDERDDLTNLNP